MRVYEPLAAFSEKRAEYWRDYAQSGRAVDPAHGPRLQRAELYDSVRSGWTELPMMSDDAYVITTDRGPLICPWRLGPRIAEAIRTIDSQIPSHLVDAFVPQSIQEAAIFSNPRDVDKTSPEIAPGWHEQVANWHVPIRWFSCVDIGDREMSISDDRRVVRYRVPMARARRRVRHAYGILQTSMGKDNPVAVSARHTSEWLALFHPKSVVEVDYGGIAWVLSEAELRQDDSPQLAHDALSALATGDVMLASRRYEQLLRRWKLVRLRERRNLRWFKITLNHP